MREGVTEPIELGLDVVEGNVGGVRWGGVGGSIEEEGCVGGDGGEEGTGDGGEEGRWIDNEGSMTSEGAPRG